jgi:hypothetical protein
MAKSFDQSSAISFQVESRSSLLEAFVMSEVSHTFWNFNIILNQASEGTLNLCTLVANFCVFLFTEICALLIASYSYEKISPRPSYTLCICAQIRLGSTTGNAMASV